MHFQDKAQYEHIARLRVDRDIENIQNFEWGIFLILSISCRAVLDSNNDRIWTDVFDVLSSVPPYIERS